MTTKAFFTVADKHKAFWLGVSIFLAMSGWILITLFEMNGTVNSIKTDADNRAIMQKNMSDKVDKNYEILQGKADERENRADHFYIKGEVVKINDKLDQITGKNRTTLMSKIDTVKEKTILLVVKLDTVKRLLETKLTGIPYKEINNLVINSK